MKETVEHDDANKSLTRKGLEGHLMEDYKVYNVTWKLTPKASGSSLKITMDYETPEAGNPPPSKYFDCIISLAKEIDQGLSKA